MRRLLLILVLLFAAPQVSAQPSGPRFISIAFHDVVDRPEDLAYEAITTPSLVQFFDWLKGTGWTAISLDDVRAAADGGRPLPDKAILLTFDDGLKSLYTRVFPLLRAYRYPAVASLVGSWMEDTPDGLVLYGDKKVPRSTFVSWAEAREMQESGLVELASHSFDLHQGIQANPQGGRTPSAMTWRYDPAARAYADDAGYRVRIREDLERSRQTMAAQLGRAPRTLVWPYGRYTGPGLEIAKQAGFTFALTLEPEPAYASDLFEIPRSYPTDNPSLADLVRDLTFAPDRPKTHRIACLSLDALAAVPDGVAQNEALGRMIEDVRALGADTVVLDANVALSSPGAPLGAVYFPTDLRPLAKDLLGRATWQIRTRAGVDVFLHLPVGAAAAAVGEDQVTALFGHMMRYSLADGLVIDMPPLADGPPVAARRDAVRARRDALDPAQLPAQARLAMAAFRAAAATDPRLRLMLAMSRPGAPPDWADIGLQPPVADVREVAALAERFKAGGWLEPEAAGRIAFALPPGTANQIEALRQAQRRGASDFALCPAALPAPSRLPAAFSAATYPYKP